MSIELMNYTLNEKLSDYISKLRVGVVCSRQIVNLLWRVGIDRIMYLGDFITPQDVFCDVSLDLDDANSYDVPESRENTLVVSHLAESLDVKTFKRAMRGCDLIIAHRYCRISAEVAEMLGVPFIPTIVTNILPEDIIERIDIIDKLEKFLPKNPICYSFLCSAQVIEALRLSIDGNTIIAPEAYIPSEKPPFFKKSKIW